MIEISNLTKRFGTKTAVENLSLTVSAGDLMVFLGPNGAGKTTTQRVAAGLLWPTEGRVRICDHDVHRDGMRARQFLSFVPDEPYLYDRLTGREFLHFVGSMFGMTSSGVERKTAEMIEVFRSESYIDELAQTYSHGMKQRVVLSAALMHDSKVLIIDEPTVGLDPKSSRTLIGLLRERTRQGLAVFVSTHTLSVAEELADRVGIIHEGRLIADASPDELRQQVKSAGRLEDVFLKLTEEEENEPRRMA